MQDDDHIRCGQNESVAVLMCLIGAVLFFAYTRWHGKPSAWKASQLTEIKSGRVRVSSSGTEAAAKLHAARQMLVHPRVIRLTGHLRPRLPDANLWKAFGSVHALLVGQV